MQLQRLHPRHNSTAHSYGRSAFSRCCALRKLKIIGQRILESTKRGFAADMSSRELIYLCHLILGEDSLNSENVYLGHMTKETHVDWLR